MLVKDYDPSINCRKNSKLFFGVKDFN